MANLKLQIIKDQRSTLFTKIKIKLEEYLNQPSLQSYKAQILKELATMKTGNDKRADVQYKVRIENEWTKNEVLQIVHNKIYAEGLIVAQVYKA